MTARLFIDPETGRQHLIDPDECPDVKGTDMTHEEWLQTTIDPDAGHITAERDGGYAYLRWDDNIIIFTHGWMDALCAWWQTPEPAAPIEVGDTVESYSGVRCKVLGIDDDLAWLRNVDHGAHYTVRLSDLTKVEDGNG